MTLAEVFCLLRVAVLWGPRARLAVCVWCAIKKHRVCVPSTSFLDISYITGYRRRGKNMRISSPMVMLVALSATVATSGRRNDLWVHRGKFAEGVGIDLGCGEFAKTSQALQLPQQDLEPTRSGLCVVACGGSKGCPRGVDTCNASPRCVGIALNREGTFATLKGAHQWVRLAHTGGVQARRMERCREYANKLARNQTQPPEVLQQLQHKWRSHLCSEFNRGAFYPSRSRAPGRTGSEDAQSHGLHQGRVRAAAGVSSDLVFDVGYHAGRDTALFLRKGMRVRAVEADADTIASTAARHPAVRAALRESKHSSRLEVLNVAISNSSGGTITFYALRSAPQMSSIHPSTCAAKGGGGCITKTVRTATCADLIRTHGTPILLKIDIEGADRMCLSSLRELQAAGIPLPTYVAIEDNGALDLLVSLGYTGFKLVAGREIGECDSDDYDGTHSIVPNSLGGMPWECANVVSGTSHWSNADAVRSHKLFNHAVVDKPNDLYAARISSHR